MNIEQLYPRKWLSAADLAGHSVTVTVAAVTLEQVRNPRTNREEPKLAVAFEDKQKRLLLNKTQAYALAAVGGKETDGWVGMQVTLSPAVAPNGAQTISIGRAHGGGTDAGRCADEQGEPPDEPPDEYQAAQSAP